LRKLGVWMKKAQKPNAFVRKLLSLSPIFNT